MRPSGETVVRLNGWQRIFVVISIIWTLGVGFLAWQKWPIEARNYRPWETDFGALAAQRDESLAQFIRAVYPWAYRDLSDAELEAAFRTKYPPNSQPSIVSYYTALAAECCGGVEALSRSDDTPTDIEPKTVRLVPGVGKVAFPTSMKQEEIEKRAKELSELREKNDQSLRQSNRNRQTSMARSMALLWLGPPVVLYGLGWAAGWIRRGFRQSP